MPILSSPWGKNKPARLIERVRAARASSEWSDADQRDFDWLLDASAKDAEVAKLALDLINDCIHDPELVVAAFVTLLDADHDDLEILLRMGELAEHSRNIDYLNDPPEDIALPRLIAALQAQLSRELPDDIRERLLESLGFASRMGGRVFDDITERCSRELIGLYPDYPPYLFELGLFLKTRGRFIEGTEVYRRVLEIDADPPEGYLWNLGICATGARQPELAMQAWSKLGIDLEMGAFDLPEALFSQVKLRLAENPLAERAGRSDDPGLEETIWIDRLGPCHGIIRSVLFQDLGVDYGDLILFDGAPVTIHKYEDVDVPVFPHLATLEKRNFQIYDFVASQPEPGALDATNVNLPADVVVYVHSETTAFVCRSCWEDETRDQHRHSAEDLAVVSGRIAAPPDVDASELLGMLDAEMAKLEGARLFSAALCKAAGDQNRAEFESRKAALLG